MLISDNFALKEEIHSSSRNKPMCYNVEIVPLCVLSAGSNITGLQANVSDINELIHSYNGIACWDFAAVSAHSKIDFNPSDRPNGSIDVGFFSPHKLLGGPGSPGNHKRGRRSQAYFRYFRTVLDAVIVEELLN